MLPNLDESEEINACSIQVTVEVDGEGAGLAAACSKTRPTTTPRRSSPSAAPPPASAAAIRDPLSRPGLCLPGHARHRRRRTPWPPVAETLPGKLPQRKLVTRPPRRATAPTATRSAWPPAMVDGGLPPRLRRQAPGDAARWWARPRRTTCAGSGPRPAMW